MSLHTAESIPFSFSRWSDKSLEHSTHVQGIYRNLYEKVTAVILAAMNLLDVAGLRVTLMLWCGIDPADAEA